jgi:hypothetical protein
LTYVIDIYLKTSESAESLASALYQHLRDRKRSVSMTRLGAGSGGVYEDGWAGYVFDADSGNPQDGLLLEVFRDSGVMQRRFDQLRSEAPEGIFFEMNTVAVVTLTEGRFDWPLVGSIWQVFNALWPSVVYDEVSGFDINMSDIPSL